jgi:hypothetical protein
LQPNDSRCQNLPCVTLLDGRQLHLQQRPLNSEGPYDVPRDSYVNEQGTEEHARKRQVARERAVR